MARLISDTSRVEAQLWWQFYENHGIITGRGAIILPPFAAGIVKSFGCGLIASRRCMLGALRGQVGILSRASIVGVIAKIYVFLPPCYQLKILGANKARQGQHGFYNCALSFIWCSEHEAVYIVVALVRLSSFSR